MSLEKTNSGEYICKIKNILRELKEKQQVCFSKFALQVYGNKDTIQLIKSQARHFGRVPFHEGELDVVKYDAQSYAIISGDNFEGSLEYSRVVFSISDK